MHDQRTDLGIIHALTLTIYSACGLDNPSLRDAVDALRAPALHHCPVDWIAIKCRAINVECQCLTGLQKARALPLRAFVAVIKRTCTGLCTDRAEACQCEQHGDVETVTSATLDPSPCTATGVSDSSYAIRAYYGGNSYHVTGETSRGSDPVKLTRSALFDAVNAWEDDGTPILNALFTREQRDVLMRDPRYKLQCFSSAIAGLPGTFANWQGKQTLAAKLCDAMYTPSSETSNRYDACRAVIRQCLPLPVVAS